VADHHGQRPRRAAWPAGALGVEVGDPAPGGAGASRRPLGPSSWRRPRGGCRRGSGATLEGFQGHMPVKPSVTHVDRRGQQVTASTFPTKSTPGPLSRGRGSLHEGGALETPRRWRAARPAAASAVAARGRRRSPSVRTAPAMAGCTRLGLRRRRGRPGQGPARQGGRDTRAGSPGGAVHPQECRGMVAPCCRAHHC